MTSTTKTLTTTTAALCAADSENCVDLGCCQTPGKQCYKRDAGFAQCRTGCSSGILKYQDPKPWSCAQVGLRAGLSPEPATPGSQCGRSGQDCGQSKCCYTAGMQCYEKNKYWSSCQETCKPGFKDTDGQTWSCKELGVRTPVYNWTVCSWAGDDCSATRCCNDAGMTCFKKDRTFSTCKKKCEPGWDCTRLGSSVSERGAQPAAAAGAPMTGTRLFCFAVVTPNTFEEPLFKVLREKGLGIFQCDTAGVFHGYKAKTIKSGGWNSVINTDVFLKIWNDVRKDGRYASHDWTVKVDPDAVFFPGRLKSHLQKIRPMPNSKLYLKNSPTGGGDDPWVFGFLGPIEIFSAKAMQEYFDKQDTCSDHIGHQSGEDYYMKTCMEALGVGYMEDITLLSNSKSVASCTDQWKVTFHPFKGVHVWMNCYKKSGGVVTSTV
jgi:hypothetical protein